MPEYDYDTNELAYNNNITISPINMSTVETIHKLFRKLYVLTNIKNVPESSSTDPTEDPTEEEKNILRKNIGKNVPYYDAIRQGGRWKKAHLPDIKEKLERLRMMLIAI